MRKEAESLDGGQKKVIPKEERLQKLASVVATQQEELADLLEKAFPISPNVQILAEHYRSLAANIRDMYGIQNELDSDSTSPHD